MSSSSIDALIARLEAGEIPSNSLDILVEVALFEPDDTHSSVRPNSAGTKLVYTRHDGGTDTHIAWDWTLTAEERARAIALLRNLTKGASNVL